MKCNRRGCNKEGVHNVQVALRGQRAGHIPSMSYCEDHFKQLNGGRPNPALKTSSLDDWCYEHMDCNLEALLQADEITMDTNTIKSLLQLIKGRE